MIKPAGQADSARHRIDFSNDVTLLGQNEVRPDHARQIIADFFTPRKFNQLFRFTRVKIARHPLWLFAFDAQLIELIAGALENRQAMTKLLEVA